MRFQRVFNQILNWTKPVLCRAFLNWRASKVNKSKIAKDSTWLLRFHFGVKRCQKDYFEILRGSDTESISIVLLLIIHTFQLRGRRGICGVGWLVQAARIKRRCYPPRYIMSSNDSNPTFKAVGICLAVGSGYVSYWWVCLTFYLVCLLVPHSSCTSQCSTVP